MNIFNKLWFWLLVLSIIGFIVTFILFETITETSAYPPWIWIIFGISISVVLVAFILYIVNITESNKKKEIALACGKTSKPAKALPIRYVTCPTCCEPVVDTCKEINQPIPVEIIQNTVIEEIPTKTLVSVVQEEIPNETVPIIRGILTDDRFSSQNLVPLDDLP